MQRDATSTLNHHLEVAERRAWEDQFSEDFPDATEADLREAWLHSQTRDDLAALAEMTAVSVEPGTANNPGTPVPDTGHRVGDLSFDDEAAEWELAYPGEIDQAAATRTPKREDPEPSLDRAAPKGDDPKAWNRYLVNEMGPALAVGKTEGVPAASPSGSPVSPDEDENQIPRFPSVPEDAGIDAHRPLVYYGKRDRHAEPSGTTPYLVTRRDGERHYRDLGGATELIRGLLSEVRSLDEWRVALRPGRRTQEASAIRGELASLVTNLVDKQGAQVAAVAKALDRSRDTAHALLREGRALPTPTPCPSQKE